MLILDERNFNLNTFETIRQKGIVSIPGVLEQNTRDILLRKLSMRQPQKAEAEVGPHRVKQCYDYFDNLLTDTSFQTLASDLTHIIERWTKRNPGFFSQPVQFTDLMAQRYEPGPFGISPHRDGLRYINLVALFVLKGQAEFCLCDSRSGANPVSIENEPGSLLLMRAPGFCGEDFQPFHFVGKISSQRISLGLRQLRTA